MINAIYRVGQLLQLTYQIRQLEDRAHSGGLFCVIVFVLFTILTFNKVLKVKGDVTIQADGAMSFESKKDMTLTAKNISLNAQSKIETKASMQNINADGALTLKGSVIKEN